MGYNIQLNHYEVQNSRFEMTEAGFLFPLI